MPSKTQTKTSADKSDVAKSSKTKTTKKTPKAKKSETKVEPEVDSHQVDKEPDVSQTEKKTRKPRRVVDSESINKDFIALREILDEEIEKLRLNKDGKLKGIKFMRSINKRVKVLQSDTARAFKQRTKRRTKDPSKPPVQSGFMMPAKISSEMRKFMGPDAEELQSRVSVTRSICKYIKDNELQNPENKREIIPDKRLKDLLNLEDDRRIKYYEIQCKISRHFPATKAKLRSQEANKSSLIIEEA